MMVIARTLSLRKLSEHSSLSGFRGLDKSRPLGSAQYFERKLYSLDRFYFQNKEIIGRAIVRRENSPSLGEEEWTHAFSLDSRKSRGLILSAKSMCFSTANYSCLLTCKNLSIMVAISFFAKN